MKKLWATFILGLYFFFSQGKRLGRSLLRLFGYRPETAARHWRQSANDGLAVMPLEIVRELPDISGCIRCGLCEAHCPALLKRDSNLRRGPMALFSCHSRGLNELAYAKELREAVENCRACAACMAVCPRHLSLTRVLRLMKALEAAPKGKD